MKPFLLLAGRRPRPQPVPGSGKAAEARLAWFTLGTALVSVLVLLSGCASPGPSAPPLARLTPATLGLPAAEAAPVVRAQWWLALNDPALDALVERALAGQPSLQAAAARLGRAQALAQGTAAADGPQLGLSADLTRQRYTEHGLVPPPIAGSQRTSATLQLNASVELDFFGRHRAALAAALGQQRAAQAELAAARVLIAGRVAQGYVGLGRLLGQRQLAEQALAQRQAQLALTRQRVQAGFDTQVELRLAEGAVPEARQQIEALDEQIALARHALAVLSGQAPGALAMLAPVLPAITEPAVPARLGADLLGRRADVVAARWRVEAATQDVALARTDFYPDINLVGFAGLSSLGLDQLLNLGSRNLGLGPALRLPIFDGGRLRAQLQGRQAELDAAIAAYNGALLEALHEVADAGASADSLGRQRTEQAQALAAAEAAYDFARQRYGAGLGSYLTVLQAETGVLAQRRLALDLKARALDSRIALMRALGGGWQDDELSQGSE
jgi:NodT family efflux transporter outer membrane factor (OMF) lipoprotein